MILNRSELLKCQNGPACLETMEASVKMSANKIEVMSMIHLFETLCLVFILFLLLKWKKKEIQFHLRDERRKKNIQVKAIPFILRATSIFKSKNKLRDVIFTFLEANCTRILPLRHIQKKRLK